MSKPWHSTSGFLNVEEKYEDLLQNNDKHCLCSLREFKHERRRSYSDPIIACQGDAVGNTGSHGDGENNNDEVLRVAGWATDFDNLLSDPAGLQTFAMFLKKEFSVENLYFWWACEKYKVVGVGLERARIARYLMEKHLFEEASDPVNVDSLARSSTWEEYRQATEDDLFHGELFLTVQTQIYHLMKLDSFPRFLKSDLFKASLLADMAAKPLTFEGHDFDKFLVTAAVNQDNRYPPFIRFILPNRATTVVSISRRETIRNLVWGLLRMRGVKCSAFDAFVSGKKKPLDLSLETSTLGCSVVKVEARVLFSLTLPSNKCISVKAKDSKLVGEVIEPILSQYGWGLLVLNVRQDHGDGRLEDVDLKLKVTSIDNSKLVVRHQFEECSPIITFKSPKPSVENKVSLYEDITKLTKRRLNDQRGLEIDSELPDFLK